MAAFRIVCICLTYLILFFQYQTIKDLKTENKNLVWEKTVLEKTIEQKAQVVQGINTCQADLERQLFETQKRLNACLGSICHNNPLKNGGLQKPPSTKTSKKLMDLYNQPL